MLIFFFPLPPSLRSGVDWQTRILKLQDRMSRQAEIDSVTNHHGHQRSGECAAAASAAFVEALSETGQRAVVRRFGRQTVWCTVSLLRRVLREASWQANDRSLTDEEAEKRLASLAVAAIGGAEA